jgi:ubiquinone biosynthesis UbiH/UbiF/VisC/COQ6 family hydroxylase
MTEINTGRLACHQHRAMQHDNDLLIIGAGPAGLALACAAADAGLSACVLEQQPREAVEQPQDDGREIALTHRARRIMQTLGLWDRVPPEVIAPLREARVLDGDSPAALRFAPTGKGLDALGWLIPNQHIRRASLLAASARDDVRLEFDARVAVLQLAPERASVTLHDGRMLHAPLVVAADSRLSSIRRMAGIGASMHDFGRSVVVGRVAHDRDNDGIAWECFRYGNTLALLPMNDGQSSAVVTVANDHAADWLALSDADFAARVEAQSGGRLGAMTSVSARHHYPLVGVYAHRFAARRFALVGDAAVGMHPVTAHGYNFGLYGVETLARELSQAHRFGADIGALAVLQRYEREHRRVTLPIYLGTNAVVSLFTDERAPAKLARRAMIAVAERAPALADLIKGAVTRQLTRDPAARAAA